MRNSAVAVGRSVHLDAFRAAPRSQPSVLAIVGRIVSSCNDFTVTSYDGGVRIVANASGGLSMALERRGEFYGIMYDLVGIDGLGAVDAEALLREGVNGRLRLRCTLRGERTVAQHLERRGPDERWSTIAGIDRSGWVTWGTRVSLRVNAPRQRPGELQQALSIS